MPSLFLYLIPEYQVWLISADYDPFHKFVSFCSMGDIEIELYWKHAPNTCRNFAELSKRGYYNGVVFHRIIADFMIQGGDPTGTGMQSLYVWLFLWDQINRQSFVCRLSVD